MYTTNAIEVRNLYKQFGAIQAVQGVQFSVQRGEIFSLLGPNGAGKSTTISILAGLLQPSAGEAAILGQPAGQARALLGVVPQDIALYPDLSARENLVFWGKMYGLRGRRLQQRVDAVLDMIDLKDRQHERVGTFSGGMKRRVNIGAALLHNPQVIIMDEPTVGIDPQSRRHILECVKELNRQGITVLYTTHYMEEAQELSHHVAIMDHGQIIACGTHAELVHLVGEQTRLELEVCGEVESAVPCWAQIPGVSRVVAGEEKVTLLVSDSSTILPRLFECAAQCGVRITALNIYEPNLEAVFLHLTGRALRD
jgi:ABC-2 type transport system ATP-binding protein